MSDTALSDADYLRYMRQLVIQPFNISGQTRLKDARVLVVGAGGLGSPVIAYLAAAGVGQLSIVDHDEVSLSNLNRQVLYRTDDVGERKAEVARLFARGLNSEISVSAYPVRIEAENVDHLVSSHDVVVDGSDNIETRRSVAAACLRHGKVLVCGAVGQLEGHVCVFPPKGVEVPSGFDTLYPPENGAGSSCEATGVIGAVTGVIGSLMAMETIKVLARMGQPIEGRTILFDALAGRFEDRSLTERAPKYLVGG
jgi:molybdopterin/thiamine biosynthesis adenylyltransferase